jgi:hypothetical protein
MRSAGMRGSGLRIAVVFLVGMLIGVIAMGLLSTRGLRTHREVIRIEYATKQDFLASRAARRGDNLTELVHRWNGVELRRSDGGGEWVAHERSFWQDVAFPFAAPVLEAIKRVSDPDGRGHRFDEALHRSMLAVALEKLEREDLANEEWSLAVQLSGRPEPDLRSAAEGLAELEGSEEYPAAAEAILGAESLVPSGTETRP